MSATFKFLIVDDVVENRCLLSRTLLRKFPDALVQECRDVEPAASAANAPDLTAIVVHRATELDGPALVTRLRSINASVPIVLVSGRESCPEAIGAGATAFLNSDAWLRIGTVVDEILSGVYVKPITATPFMPSAESHRWTYTPPPTAPPPPDPAARLEPGSTDRG